MMSAMSSSDGAVGSSLGVSSSTGAAAAAAAAADVAMRWLVAVDSLASPDLRDESEIHEHESEERKGRA